MTFDELRDRVFDEKKSCVDYCIDNMHDFSQCDLGRYQGQIMAYDNMLAIMRGIEKWGELE